MALTNTASLASSLTVAKLSYGCELFSEAATSITRGNAGQSPTLCTPHQRGTPVLRRGDRRVAITWGKTLHDPRDSISQRREAQRRREEPTQIARGSQGKSGLR